MVLRAYAKINLGLRIVNRRPDGFHSIETIFHRIDLADTITLTPAAEGIVLTCSDPSLPVDDTNLCRRAAAALQRECGTVQGAVMHLEKAIPTGAGLGGGSSDAAAILRHLPALWNVHVPHARLAAIGASLGSDVPFFLQDASAYAEGRGELLTPFTLRLPYWIVLVNPGIHVSTPWAYTEFSRALAAGRNVPRGSLFSASTHEMRSLDAVMVNDFEEVVFPVHPEIAALKAALLACGARAALMSGSGSSVFGLFDTGAAARNARDIYANRYVTSLTEPHFLPG